MPGHVDDGDGVVRKDARDESTLGQVFEAGDEVAPPGRAMPARAVSLETHVLPRCPRLRAAPPRNR